MELQTETREINEIRRKEFNIRTKTQDWRLKILFHIFFFSIRHKEVMVGNVQVALLRKYRLGCGTFDSLLRRLGHPDHEEVGVALFGVESQA